MSVYVVFERPGFSPKFMGKVPCVWLSNVFEFSFKGREKASGSVDEYSEYDKRESSADIDYLNFRWMQEMEKVTTST